MSERIPRPPGYRLRLVFGYSEGGKIVEYRIYRPTRSHGPDLIHVVSKTSDDGEVVETLEDVIHPDGVQYHDHGPPDIPWEGSASL